MEIYTSQGFRLLKKIQDILQKFIFQRDNSH